MDKLKPVTLTPEFATLLKHAATVGRALRVEIDDHAYELTVPPADSDASGAIWKDYDPERLRQALRRNARLPERTEPQVVEEILANIWAQRGQNSQGRPSVP